MSLVTGLLLALAYPHAQEPSPVQDSARSHALDVLYVAGTEPGYAARQAAMRAFLDERFGEVRVAEHGKVTPTALAGIEVVVLDWHQGEDFDESPLGPREQWTTPTLLLGSAGLLLAKKWEVLGGSG
jgi:hypothetical protein